MIQAVIFDLDGLLADTEGLQFRAVRYALASESIPLDIATYQERWIQKGESIANYITEFDTELDEEHFRKIKRKFYHTEIAEKLKPMPGAESLLHALDGRLPIGLATASVAESVNRVLETLDFKRYFATIVTKHDVANPKPSPDCFLLAAERLDVAPENCVVLEDAEKGVIAASRAGMKCVAVPNQYTENNDFSLATITLESLNHVTLEFLQRL